MQKPRRGGWLLITALILLVLLAGVALVLQSGILVRPTARKLAAMTEVPGYDILTAQAALEQDILADYAEAHYTLAEPYIIVDPYDMNPLSALVLFDPAGTKSITVTVSGDDAASTLSYVKAVDSARAEVPILGLYAGRDNTVTLTSDTGESSVL
ncbi:MAG: aryl-sulfate sulfotransferase N-terminal domain-containing protein, partial [Clostridiaceae bacterium]